MVSSAFWSEALTIYAAMYHRNEIKLWVSQGSAMKKTLRDKVIASSPATLRCVGQYFSHDTCRSRLFESDAGEPVLKIHALTR